MLFSTKGCQIVAIAMLYHYSIAEQTEIFLQSAIDNTGEIFGKWGFPFLPNNAMSLFVIVIAIVSTYVAGVLQVS